MKSPRSYLFVPGDRPDRFGKAVSSGAHRIVLDLEDAVGLEAKARARREVARWLADGGNGFVRVNPADTPWFDEDLRMAEASPGTSVVVPKAEPQSLHLVSERLPGRPLIALVETVAGLMSLPEVARSSGVERLAFGHLDFCLDARIPGTAHELDPIRFQLAVCSRHARLAQPIDGVTVDLNDTDRLAADIVRARSFGFGGKLCIHPRQVGPVNDGFAPSAEELAWAKRVLAATEGSPGAVRVDGKMVDRPIVERAKAILADAADPASG